MTPRKDFKKSFSFSVYRKNKKKKQNKTKNKTKRKETKRNETKRNETKQKQTNKKQNKQTNKNRNSIIVQAQFLECGIHLKTSKLYHLGNVLEARSLP